MGQNVWWVGEIGDVDGYGFLSLFFTLFRWLVATMIVVVVVVAERKEVCRCR